MQEFQGPEPNPDQVTDRKASSELDRKFWIAMLAYGILAAVIWFTLGEGTVFVLGRPVEIRLIPLLVIGTFAFRTYIAREAEKIRRRSQDEAR